MEGIAESGIAIEVSTAGLRKPVGELYPARAFLEMVLDAGNPIALSSDAHTPEDLGRDYDQALELLEELGVTRARGLRAPRAAAGADRVTATTGIGWDSHRLVAGRPLILGGVRDRARARPRRALRRRRAHPRDHRRAAGRRRRWATSASTSPTPTSATATRTRCSCCARCVATLAERGLARRPRRRDRRHGAPQARAPPRRDPRARWPTALGVAPDHVNVKASTGEGMGFVGRGEGVAALAVATLHGGVTALIAQAHLDLVLLARAGRRLGAARSSPTTGRCRTRSCS